MILHISPSHSSWQMLNNCVHTMTGLTSLLQKEHYEECSLILWRTFIEVTVHYTFLIKAYFYQMVNLNNLLFSFLLWLLGISELNFVLSPSAYFHSNITDTALYPLSSFPLWLLFFPLCLTFYHFKSRNCWKLRRPIQGCQGTQEQAWSLEAAISTLIQKQKGRSGFGHLDAISGENS
jgi:hypothetical protein